MSRRTTRVKEESELEELQKFARDERPKRASRVEAFVECPICSKRFFCSEINSHVERCLTAEELDTKPKSSPKPLVAVVAAAETKKTAPPVAAHNTPSQTLPKPKKNSPSPSSSSSSSSRSSPPRRLTASPSSVSPSKASPPKKPSPPRPPRKRDPVLMSIPEAPTFRPTEQEFVDPMKYIESIRPVAEKFGICKIVPPTAPEVWLKGKTFQNVVQPDNFCFETKCQNIWELSKRGSRAEFLKQLSKFCADRKIAEPSTFISFDQHRFHSFLLWRELLTSPSACPDPLPRFEDLPVSVAAEWKNIASRCGLQGENATRFLFLWFRDHLHPFFLSQRSKMSKMKGVTPSKSSQLAAIRTNSKDAKMHDDEDDDDPKNFGFEEGRIYTLSGFRSMSSRFFKRYYDLPQNVSSSSVPLANIERDFWNIVEQKKLEGTEDKDEIDDVSVLYGSDLDAKTHGSGFPSDQTSIWDLNNFPVSEGSILRFLPQPVSGVTIPMLYVGMLFSCFCWHVEDDFLASINYLHTGAPKTWYGVSSAHAQDFETVMKTSMPDLFEAQPDLLHHLITMLPPSELVRNNVPVFRLHQYPGEFVITFPRAYHAGFNNGYNCAEAVNFATADWVKFASASLEEYKKIQRSHVVSYEELIYEGVLKENSKICLQHYIAEFEKMIKKEKERRVKARSIAKNVDHWDDSIRTNSLLSQSCSVCNSECYFSAFVCPSHPGLYACLDHNPQSLCACADHQKILKERFSIKHLEKTLLKAIHRFYSMFPSSSSSSSLPLVPPLPPLAARPQVQAQVPARPQVQAQAQVQVPPVSQSSSIKTKSPEIERQGQQRGPFGHSFMPTSHCSYDYTSGPFALPGPRPPQQQPRPLFPTASLPFPRILPRPDPHDVPAAKRPKHF